MRRAPLIALAGTLAGAALAGPAAAPDPLIVVVREFAIAGATGRLEWRLEAGRQRLELSVERLDLPALAALARGRSAWLDAHVVGAGTARLSLDCVLTRAVGWECDLALDVEGLDLAGATSAERAALALEARYVRDGAGERVAGQLTLRAGALYLEPGLETGGITPGVLWTVADAPITAAATLSRRTAGPLLLERLRLDHPGVATLEFAGQWPLAPGSSWQVLDLALETPALDAFYATYAQPFLLGTELDSLTGSGRLTLAARGMEGALAALEVYCTRCRIADEHGRFAVAGVQGGLVLHDGAGTRRSALAWEEARILALVFGPGRIEWASGAGEVRAVDWQDVPLFDGLLRIEELVFSDPGAPGARMRLRGELSPVTLARVTEALGWPPLTGHISGVIPTVSYEGGRLAVDGDLAIEVFGGRVLLRDLRIDDLFGDVPRLRTDVEAEGLDLAELTGTFAFGNIEGTLAGRIDDLRMEAWEPVSFDAHFATPRDDERPHRISRQAVSNLSRLGAGTSGALGQGWLALIPAYSYGELGLGCTLEGGHCTMRGVRPADGDSFYLLTRGGLLPPWIEIKASGARIAWSELVEGLRQIARGEWEVDVDVGPG